ncbi:MAG TPA: VWA domain-containing protein, partial [Blastocatellia bacterium]|nr:VWA domain-containing protein [Blastocatellia bacterium]
AIVLVGGTEEENPGALRRLCRDTGGLAFFPTRGQSVAEISKIVARDLREQYTLGFTPGKRGAGSYRKIRVTVTAPGRGKLFVQTRAGYSTAP